MFLFITWCETSKTGVSPVFPIIYVNVFEDSWYSKLFNDKSVVSVVRAGGNKDGYIPYGGIPGTPLKSIGYTPNGCNPDLFILSHSASEILDDSDNVETQPHTPDISSALNTPDISIHVNPESIEILIASVNLKGLFKIILTLFFLTSFLLTLETDSALILFNDISLNIISLTYCFCILNHNWEL